MSFEKIIAKKDTGQFFNYSVLIHENKKNDMCDLALLVSLVRTTILQDIFDYETGISEYDYGLSDEWSVKYDYNSFYIEIYDFWAEQEATKKLEDGTSELILSTIKSLKIKTKSNLLKIINSWKIIYKNKPQYIIITRDQFDWIYLDYKDELSEKN